MSPFVEGLLAGYGIAIPLGAVAVLIVNTAMRCGFSVGFCAGAGAASADLLYAVLASVAGAALSAALAPLAGPLRLFGGLVLIALAAMGLRRGWKQRDEPGRTADRCAPLTMYAQFLGITILNPLTVLYFTAFVLGRGGSATGYGLASNVWFVAGVGLASLSWQTLLAMVGGLARFRMSAAVRKLAILLGNTLVLALGVRVLLSALR
jgi:arginine exporter protein ArgO